MNMSKEERGVLTLDAGGTNFVFSAIRNYKEIVEPVTLQPHPDDLGKCLDTIIRGFEDTLKKMDNKPVAISFAFPGPSNYEMGILENLVNFPAIRGGVALGPMLEKRFRMPVYINNDGDLFAYGEALAGYLPYLNEKIKSAGGYKTYRNLIGLTLGTGFGGGIVFRGHMLRGDNSCGAEVHNLSNKFKPGWNAEEHVSARGISRIYARHAGLNLDTVISPEEISRIALAGTDGEQEAAKSTYGEFGEQLGHSIAVALTMVDGIAVLGGGITAAWELFAPSMFAEINRNYHDPGGNLRNRLSYRVYNLEDENAFKEFVIGNPRTIQVPKSRQKIQYDDLYRTGVGLSRLGASRAIALGAYSFALRQLDLDKE